MSHLSDSVPWVPWVQGKCFSSKEVRGLAPSQLPKPVTQGAPCLSPHFLPQLGSLTSAIRSDYYSNCAEPGGQTKISYSHFHRAEVNRLSHLTHFPSALSDWVRKRSAVRAQEAEGSHGDRAAEPVLGEEPTQALSCSLTFSVSFPFSSSTSHP